MEALWQDVKYGARMLARSPGFTAVAVLTLALGIGANTALFSVVNAVLLRPLPFDEPDRLVMVWENNLSKGWKTFTVAPGNFLDWREQNRVFEDMAAFDSQNVNLTGVSEPERLSGAAVSASLFPLLRVEPFLGRNFTAEEDQPDGARAVILSYSLWQRLFGGSRDALGQTLALNSERHTVVGIMPPDFGFPTPTTALWVPLALNYDRVNRGGRYLLAVARLKPGVSLGEAQNDMNAIAKRIEQEFPAWASGMGVTLVPLHEQVVGDIRASLWILLGCVGFILLIACANVANLLLARAAARRSEVAVRRALGAGRARLARQLLCESVLLALLGGALGLLTALWGTNVLRAWQLPNVPRLDEVSVDGWVLGFTAGVSLLTGLLFGLAPAWQAATVDVNESLKQGGRRGSAEASRRRASNLLVVTEVALSLVLLTGAGLMIRSFLLLRRVDPGFQPQNALTLRIALPESRYADGAAVVSFYQQVMERLLALPGVRYVGATHALPLTGMNSVRPFWLADRPTPPPGEELTANYRLINSDYFRAMGIRLLRGRFFSEEDAGNAPPVAIVNQAFARHFLPGEDAVGRRITIGGYADLWGEVVGVVNDVRHFTLGVAPRPEMYWLYSQDWLQRSGTLQSHRRRLMSLVVRTAVDPRTMIAAVKEEVRAVDPGLPVFRIVLMEEWVSASTASERFYMILLGLFAVLALALAAIGIYGVVSYSFSQRTHEIGIRMALGAQPRHVFKLVVGHGLALTLLGTGLGLAAAFALTRFLSALLYEISATDPATFSIVVLVLLGVAALACYVPARRAARVDPMVSLRCE